MSRKTPSDLKRDARFLLGAVRLLAWTRSVTPESETLVPDDFERAVDLHRNRVAFRFEGSLTTYGEFEARANKYAHWAIQQDLQPGDVVGLLMENRPDYVAAWVGLTKAGIVPALLNSNLEGESLAHCLNIVGARAMVAGAGFDAAIRSARPHLECDLEIWSLSGYEGQNLALELAAMPGRRPDRLRRETLRGRDLCLYMYTSGTTGMPKAARMTHARTRNLMRTFIGPCNITPKDRVYVTLPLYHGTGGLCGIGQAMMAGASVILRRRFSAKAFWEDAAGEGATSIVYIGELCRYLLNQPVHLKERAHRIRTGFGNGLRPDVWAAFSARFGISDLKEAYGSTEGNVSLMNIDGRPGACGRIPSWMKKPFAHVAIAKFDVGTELPVRGADGFCVRAGAGESGEVLGRIGEDTRTRFEGYTSEDDTDRKILRDVFEPGDMWFRTGDLMYRDADGYVYFVDRIGDTFRWKGENVATCEVGEAMSKVRGIETANVYGVAVPGTEGKAGMAAVTANADLDIAGLHRMLAERLPGYAIPLFLRVQKEPETTSTFKFRKIELVKQGFDPDAAGDPIFMLNPEKCAYEPMTAAAYKRVVAGGVRF